MKIVYILPNCVYDFEFVKQHYEELKDNPDIWIYWSIEDFIEDFNLGIISDKGYLFTIED